VRLTDGSTVTLTGTKLVESRAGTLLLLGRHTNNPVHFVAAGAWVECAELPSERGER
jgi:hypothetical protein